jgi:hypothetical protein
MAATSLGMTCVLLVNVNAFTNPSTSEGPKTPMKTGEVLVRGGVLVLREAGVTGAVPIAM